MRREHPLEPCVLFPSGDTTEQDVGRARASSRLETPTLADLCCRRKAVSRGSCATLLHVASRGRKTAAERRCMMEVRRASRRAVRTYVAVSIGHATSYSAPEKKK